MTIQQKCHIHTLLILRQCNLRTLMKTPHGIYPSITRILISKNVYGERMFTTQIVRAVTRVARVRYLLLGAAGAGGVAAKMVSCITCVKYNNFRLQVCSMYVCTDGAVVRALISQHCGPGSIPGLGVICGLSLLVLYSAPRGFPSPQKPTFDLICFHH